jgi:hypothetical protein
MLNRNNGDNQESSELCLRSPLKRSLSIFSSRKQEDHAGNIDPSGLLSPIREKESMKDRKIFSPVKSVSFALRQSCRKSPPKQQEEEDDQVSSEECLLSPMKGSFRIFSSRKQEDHAGDIDLSGLLSPKLEKTLMQDRKVFSPVKSISFALRQSVTLSQSFRKSPEKDEDKGEEEKEDEENDEEEDEDEEDDEPYYYEDNEDTDEESPMTEEEALLLLCKEFELIGHGEQ